MAHHPRADSRRGQLDKNNVVKVVCVEGVERLVVCLDLVGFGYCREQGGDCCWIRFDIDISGVAA